LNRCALKENPPQVSLELAAAPMPMMDIYDGADWTEMDIEDLKSAIESGSSIAQFLCRADSVDDVARKCAELGLKPKVRS
jgi:hypothetical protein